MRILYLWVWVGKTVTSFWDISVAQGWAGKQSSVNWYPTQTLTDQRRHSISWESLHHGHQSLIIQLLEVVSKVMGYLSAATHNSQEIDLQGGKIYVGSWSQRSWSMKAWPCCFGFGLAWHIMAGVYTEGGSLLLGGWEVQREEEGARVLPSPSIAQLQNLTSFHESDILKSPQLPIASRLVTDPWHGSL